MKFIGYQVLSVLGLLSITTTNVSSFMNSKRIYHKENEEFLAKQRLLTSSNLPAD